MPDSSVRNSSLLGEAPRIVTNVPVSGQSPEEVMRSLERFNIEWYISGEGHLIIKTWQVVARDFVTREQAVRIREGRSTLPQADALGWISSHLDELQSQYGGQWVGVARGRVIASAPNLQELMAELGRLGVTDPFITQIPAGSIVWRTTYGG